MKQRRTSTNRWKCISTRQRQTSTAAANREALAMADGDTSIVVDRDALAPNGDVLAPADRDASAPVVQDAPVSTN